MSKQNKVNKDHYVQRGRLTPDELARQQENVKALRAGASSVDRLEGLDTSSLDWAAHVMDERTEESRATHDHA